VKKLKITLNILIAVSLSACGAVKNLFPDKGKDYQLTAEIPELIVPADLTTYNQQSTATINNQTPIIEQPTKPENTVSEPSDTKPDVVVELVEYSGGATRIRIEDSIQRTWRIVGKALSRNAIEITKRNEYEYLYTVEYDPNFKSVEDGSLWDEVLFIFGNDPANEQTFKIRLAENGMLTEIIVLDNKDQPQSAGNGFKLLNLLYKTIKADLANSQ